MLSYIPCNYVGGLPIHSVDIPRSWMEEALFHRTRIEKNPLMEAIQCCVRMLPVLIGEFLWNHFFAISMDDTVYLQYYEYYFTKRANPPCIHYHHSMHSVEETSLVQVLAISTLSVDIGNQHFNGRELHYTVPS